MGNFLIKKLYLFYLIAAVIVSSCSDGPTQPQVNPYEQQLSDFNKSSGFNAVLIDDTGIVNTAKRSQGSAEYPGVDDWFAVEIDNGLTTLGGLPGQSAFYSILETYNMSGGNKELYWRLLQVKPHPVFGYRPKLGCYQTNWSIKTAISKTLSNPQYGEGGGWQLYISDYSVSLSQFAEITLDTTLSR